MFIIDMQMKLARKTFKIVQGYFQVYFPPPFPFCLLLWVGFPEKHTV